jgi:membrane protease YdiL (CAAX protease family)
MNKPVNSKPLINAGWLRTVLYFIALLLFTGIILGIYIFWLHKDVSVISMILFFTDINKSGLFALIFLVLTLTITYVFRRLIDRKSFISLGFNITGYFRDAMAGGMLAIFIIGASCLILKGTGHLKWMDIIFDPRALFTAFGTIVLVAVCEELIFRGYLLSNLLDSFPKGISMLISALLFMIFHWSSAGFFPMINTLILGLILGLNYTYTRNLWFSICFHIGWKFGLGPVMGFPGEGSLQSLLQTELQGNENATGGANGLGGSYIFGTVSLLSLLALYVFLQKKFNQQSQPVPDRR